MRRSTGNPSLILWVRESFLTKGETKPGKTWGGRPQPDRIETDQTYEGYVKVLLAVLSKNGHPIKGIFSLYTYN